MQELNLKRKSARELITEPAFLQSGNELYLFNMDRESLTDESVSLGLLKKDWLRVHMFMTSLNNSRIGAAAELIREFYALFHRDAYRIGIYYPENSICEELGLQEIPIEWYNFFINLWDELLIEEYKEKPEYIYRPVPAGKCAGAHAYTLQLLLPGEFDILVRDRDMDI